MFVKPNLMPKDKLYKQLEAGRSVCFGSLHPTQSAVRMIKHARVNYTTFTINNPFTMAIGTSNAASGWICLGKFNTANTTLLLQSFLSREISCGDVRFLCHSTKSFHRTVFANFIDQQKLLVPTELVQTKCQLPSQWGRPSTKKKCPSLWKKNIKPHWNHLDANEEPLPGRSSVHKTRVLHRNYFPAVERHIPCTETVAWEEVSSKMSCNWNSGCKHNPERSSTVHHLKFTVYVL